MFDSLKNQIIAVIAILISIILLQVYFSRATQSELIQSQESSNHSYANVALVHELERDIIDLQRHLHIHKETASTSAITRFYELMTRVKEKLSLFENDSKIVFIKTLELSLLDNMRKHLNDYEENFNSVINWRSQRKVIFNDNIQFNLKLLDQIIKQYESKENTKNNTSDLALKYHLAMAEKSINQYLIFPDSEHIREINQQLTSAKMVIPKNFNEHKQATALINAVKKDFIRLSQITRGYIFLVNVVMAGSANEFLYLTKKLRETVLDEQLTLSEESKIKTEQEQIKTIVIAIISIIITLLVALFILSRMIKPIRNITDVFAKLADGEALLEIPGINRRDEIGNLAKAANVFRDKNRQTLELLSSAQYMNNAQKALNRELKIAKKKAELAAESKSMFLANMSHEIRTPMNGIIGLIELTRNTELNPQQAHHLQMAAYSGQVMMNVINDILDFSKIEAGKMEIESVEFNIDELIENLISVVASMLAEKEIKFRVQTSPNLPKYLYGDPLRISQILLNLCNNAIKFTQQGLVRVSIDYNSGEQDHLIIEITDTGIGMSQAQVEMIFNSFTQADGSTSRQYGGTGLGLTIVKELCLLMEGDVAVSSTEGKGSRFTVNIKSKAIRPTRAIEVIEYTGDIFYLADTSPYLEDCHFQNLNVTPTFINQENIATLKTNVKQPNILLIDESQLSDISTNTELLLHIKHLKLNIGLIIDGQFDHSFSSLKETLQATVLSHPFTPSQYHNFVNALSGQHAAPDIEIQQQPNIKFEGHILIVEDNAINQIVAESMAQQLGLSCDIVSNGQEAVDQISQYQAYDLVLMDVQMPIMGGYEATQAIRAAGFSNLIICGLSANAMKEDFDLAAAAGMNDYLTKPIEPESLQQMLKKYLKVS